MNHTLGFLFVCLCPGRWWNYKEGQVTFLCTNFRRKSYENLFTVGSALTPSSLGLNDRAELPADWQVTERQCHGTSPLLSLPESLKQMTSADGTWEDKVHGAWGKPAQLRLCTFSSVLENIFMKTWPTQLLPHSTQVMYLQKNIVILSNQTRRSSSGNCVLLVTTETGAVLHCTQQQHQARRSTPRVGLGRFSFRNHSLLVLLYRIENSGCIKVSQVNQWKAYSDTGKA